MSAAGVSVWQVLPLGPVGPNFSPYWVRSDQAGNPALIDRRVAPGPAQARGDYEDFCAAERAWGEDYVVYAALRQAHGSRPRWTRPPPVPERRARALGDGPDRP